MDFLFFGPCLEGKYLAHARNKTRLRIMLKTAGIGVQNSSLWLDIPSYRQTLFGAKLCRLSGKMVLHADLFKA